VVALTEIPYVKGARARLLYKAGLRTPEAVAAVDLERLVEILATGAPAAGKGASEDQQRRAEKRAARMILEGAAAARCAALPAAVLRALRRMLPGLLPCWFQHQKPVQCPGRARAGPAG
jgi:hypothetical protein